MEILIEATGGDGGETKVISVNMTSEKASKLLSLREQSAPMFEIEGFRQIGFKEYGVSAHTGPEFEKEDEEVIACKNELTEAQLDSTRMGIYWCEVRFQKDGLYWEGNIKHSPEIFQSAYLTWDLIKKFAANDFSYFDQKKKPLTL